MRVRVCFLVAISLLAFFKVRAQKDTVLLQTVTVYGIPEEKYLAGSRIEKLDSAIKASYRSNNLGEVLSFQFPIYFRTYGNGMLSGISMRGTSPQHTAVLWNGININSFSLGQTDFSILPAVAFDNVKIHSGGGSARFGSGAFGGTVLLQTGDDEGSVVEANVEAGSFGRYFSSVKASIRKGVFSSSSSFYRLQSENNFPIPRNGRQQHAAFYQQGFVQHLQFAISDTRVLKLDYWFHEADREIQPTIGKQNNPVEQKDEQQDRNNRLSVSYQQNSRAGLLKAGGGVVHDRIVFNGNPGDVLRYVAFINHQYSFSNHWNVQAGVDWNHIIGKIEEHDGNPVEDRIDAAVSVQREFDRIKLSTTLRQPFITGVEAPLLPYVGADLLVVSNEDHNLLISGNVSKNFRAPTLNDRYWQDVGRKDLRPETSHAAELGFSWLHHSLKLSSAAFGQVVDNWIQWTPDSVSGIYRPDNIKQVYARGVETSIETRKKWRDLAIHFKASYQITKSTTEKAFKPETASIGKQLIYTPVHTASVFFITEFKSWSFNLFAQYSGKRFTESTNAGGDYALDPFVLTDLSIGKSFIAGRNAFQARVTVKNIFNTSYQLYSARAMPGRHFNIQVSYQLKYKSNQL